MAIYSGFSHKKIVIFHGYVSLPEGNRLRWATGINISANDWCQSQQAGGFKRLNEMSQLIVFASLDEKYKKNITVWNHPMHCPPSLLGYIGMIGNKLGGSFEVEHSLDSHRVSYHRVIVSVSFGGPSDPRLARALARKFAQQLPGSCWGPVCGSQLVPICSVAIRSLWLALFIDVKWCKSLRRSKNLGTSWYILVPMEKSRNYWDSGIGCHAPKGRCGFSMDQLLAVLWKCPFGPQNRNLVLFICISSGISRMNSIDFEMLPWHNRTAFWDKSWFNPIWGGIERPLPSSSQLVSLPQ